MQTINSNIGENVMDYGSCHICGALLKPFARGCTVCGFWGEYDDDRESSVDDTSMDVLEAFFRTDAGLDSDYAG